jgi:rhodanese-related sulfurtransferase
MNRPVIQALLLVIASAVVAVVANAMAGRERKLILPGFYPNAMKVPARPAPAPPTPVPTTTVAEMSPGPGQPPMPIETTTVAPALATQPVQSQPKAAAPKPAPAAEVPLLQKFPPHPDSAYVEIGYDAVAELHRRGALFLDARRTSVYEEGHIAGARPFSVWESDVDDKVMTLFDERGDPEQQKQPIVIYCSGGDCEDSHMLAEKLWGIQFNNVLVYKDGYPDWVRRRGATRQGSNP